MVLVSIHANHDEYHTYKVPILDNAIEEMVSKRKSELFLI